MDRVNSKLECPNSQCISLGLNGFESGSIAHTKDNQPIPKFEAVRKRLEQWRIYCMEIIDYYVQYKLGYFKVYRHRVAKQ